MVAESQGDGVSCLMATTTYKEKTSLFLFQCKASFSVYNHGSPGLPERHGILFK
jgi:hypothetical protein